MSPDTPTAEDIKVAAAFVRACGEACEPRQTIVEDRCRLVAETAWKVHDRRLGRELRTPPRTVA